MTSEDIEQSPANAGDESNGRKDPNEMGFLAVMFSVVAAAFGVQSKANRERDFEQSSFLPYIFGGILFTVIFVAILLLLVRSVLAA